MQHSTLEPWLTLDLCLFSGAGYVVYELVKAAFPQKKWRPCICLPTANNNSSPSVSCLTGMSYSWDQRLFHIISDDLGINKFFSWLTPAGYCYLCFLYSKWRVKPAALGSVDSHQGAPFTDKSIPDEHVSTFFVYLSGITAVGSVGTPNIYVIIFDPANNSWSSGRIGLMAEDRSASRPVLITSPTIHLSPSMGIVKRKPWLSWNGPVVTRDHKLYSCRGHDKSHSHKFSADLL